MKNKFIISKEKVLEQYDIIRGLGDFVSYSSKTNPIVANILEEEIEDCMFSIHMKNELSNVRDKKRVIFLAQGWDDELIGELIGQGIRWFVVDNERDLDILLNYLKDFEEKINLLLRVRLKEHTLKTERYFVFGMGSELVNLKIKELRGNGKIDKLGVHFHRKTQNMAEWNLIYDFQDMIDKVNFCNIDVVCIGGGLPVDYANTNVNVINSIFKRIKNFRDFLSDEGIKMIVEPGRFIAAPAGKLKTKIVRVYDNNIVVDVSVYNSDLDALIVPVKLLVEGEVEKEKGKAFVIKGTTPCSMDLFRYRVYLEEEKVKEGNEIVFLNAGAYNYSTDFCGLEKLETLIL